MNNQQPFYLELVGQKRKQPAEWTAIIKLTGPQLQRMPDIAEMIIDDIVYKQKKNFDYSKSNKKMISDLQHIIDL